MKLILLKRPKTGKKDVILILMVKKQIPSYQNTIDVDKISTQRTKKAIGNKNDEIFKFKRFSLRKDHLQNLECKGKSLKSWLHGETIVAYLESRNPTSFVFEDFQTQRIFSNKPINL